MKALIWETGKHILVNNDLADSRSLAHNTDEGPELLDIKRRRSNLKKDYIYRGKLLIYSEKILT